MIKPWKVLKTRLVHKTDWIEVVENEVEAESGELTYTYTRRVDEGPMMVPEDTNGFWMVRQYRHPIGKIVWQFPAEGKHEGESWEAAAERGLEEELGVEANELIYLADFHPDPGGLQQVSKIFLARGLSKLQQSRGTDVHENLEVGLFSMQEIDEMIGRGEICDGWTLGCLYLYQRYLKRLEK